MTSFEINIHILPFLSGAAKVVLSHVSAPYREFAREFTRLLREMLARRSKSRIKFAASTGRRDLCEIARLWYSKRHTIGAPVDIQFLCDMVERAARVRDGMSEGHTYGRDLCFLAYKWLCDFDYLVDGDPFLMCEPDSYTLCRSMVFGAARSGILSRVQEYRTLACSWLDHDPESEKPLVRSAIFGAVRGGHRELYLALGGISDIRYERCDHLLSCAAKSRNFDLCGLIWNDIQRTFGRFTLSSFISIIATNGVPRQRGREYYDFVLSLGQEKLTPYQAMIMLHAAAIKGNRELCSLILKNPLPPYENVNNYGLYGLLLGAVRGKVPLTATGLRERREFCEFARDQVIAAGIPINIIHLIREAVQCERYHMIPIIGSWMQDEKYQQCFSYDIVPS